MRIDGRVVYGWCAWDTLFIPPLLGTPSRVESTCAATGERVVLQVRLDGIQDAAPALGVSLIAPGAEKASADIRGEFCRHVQFLTAGRAAEEWAGRHRAAHIATLQQAWELGRRHNALRYARQTP